MHFHYEDLLKLVESSENSASTSAPSSGLSEGQKSRAEKNRLKALALKKARLTARPYPEPKKFVDPLDELSASSSKKSETKLVDTNAGFFIEEDPDEPFDNYLVPFLTLEPLISEPHVAHLLAKYKILYEEYTYLVVSLGPSTKNQCIAVRQCEIQQIYLKPTPSIYKLELYFPEQEVEREPAPVIEPDRPTCLECRDELVDSFLFKTFDLEVCDKCRDTEKDGKHELVTQNVHFNNIVIVKNRFFFS